MAPEEAGRGGFAMPVKSRLAAAAVAIGLVAAACGGDDPAATTAPATATTAVGAAASTTAATPSTTAPAATTTTTAGPDTTLPFRLGDEPEPFDAEFVDSAAPVSAEIGVEGGTIEAVAPDGTTFELRIPNGALFAEETITMTPVESAAGTLPDGAIAAGVRLEPEGLLFLASAELDITPPSIPSDGVVALGAAAAGENLHLFPSTETGGVVTLPVAHFSIYTIVGSGPNLAGLFSTRVPSGREQQALALLAYVDGRFSDSENYRAERNQILADWATGLLGDVRSGGPANDWTLLNLAGEAMSLSYQLAGADAAVLSLFGAIQASLSQAMEAAASRAFERCVSGNEPEQAFKILRWWFADVSFSLLVVPPSAANESHYRRLLDGCFRFEFVVDVDSSGVAEDISFEVAHRARIPMEVPPSTGGPRGLFVGSSGGRISFPSFMGQQPVTRYTLQGSLPDVCKPVGFPGEVTVEIEGDLLGGGFRVTDLQAPAVLDRVESLTVDVLWEPPPQTIVDCGQGVNPPVPTWAPWFLDGDYDNVTFSSTSDTILTSFAARIELPTKSGGTVFAEDTFPNSYQGVRQTTRVAVEHVPRR
jgi:hypothetical protein